MMVIFHVPARNDTCCITRGITREHAKRLRMFMRAKVTLESVEAELVSIRLSGGCQKDPTRRGLCPRRG
jgi:hypothetical protein